MKKFRKQRRSPYAHIQWDKAAALFPSHPSQQKKKFPISASSVLHLLATAADKGLMFATHAADPAIVEYMLEGTGPLNWRTRNMIHRFQKQKYVHVHEAGDGTVTVKITKNGFAHALSYQLDTMKVQEKKQWDKKWRVVVFDVPEKYKRLRDVFRSRLEQLGLYRLQDSVYVSPYPCFDEVEFLRELYGIAFTTQYLLVEKIEDDRHLRTHFHLAS
mgnify:FL=1